MSQIDTIQDVFNKDVQNWAKVTRSAVIQQLNSLDLASQIEVLQKAREKENRKPLKDTIRTRVRKFSGIAEAVNISFSITGFWLDRGVGKDTPIELVGSTDREANPWIDPVLDLRVEALADIALEFYGDEALEAIKIQLK